MDTPSGKRSIVYVVFPSLFVFGIFVNARSFLLQDISNSFSISYTESGLLFFIGLLDIGITNLIAGRIMAKKGMRYLFTIGLLLSGFFILMQATSTSYFMFLAFIPFIGFGIRSKVMGANSLVTRAFRDDGGARLNVMHICYGAGALIAPLFASVLVKNGLSWRTIYTIIAVLFLLLLLYKPFYAVRETEKSTVVRIKDVTAMLKNRQVLWLSITIMVIVGFEIGITSWLVYTLKKAFNFSVWQAGFYMSGFFLFMILGRLFGLRMARKNKLASMLLPFAVIQIFLHGAGILLLPASAFLFSLCGFTVSIFFPTLTYMLNDASGNKYPAAITLFMIGAGLGASVFPFLVGVVSDLVSIRWGMTVNIASSILLVLTLVKLRTVISSPGNETEHD